MMISDLLASKIGIAFDAIDRAKMQAYDDKHKMPKCKETREAFAALDHCLDMLEDF